MTHRRTFLVAKAKFFVALGFLGWGGASLAQSPAGSRGDAWASGDVKKPAMPPEGAPLLLMSPKSLRGEVSVLAPGARETVFYAASQGKLGARPYSREAFKKDFPSGWKSFFEIGKTAAADHLKSLKPKLVRNENKVVEYALIQSDHPLTPAVVFCEGFAEMFSETLGNQLLIAIPDRSTVLVFSKLGGTLEEHREGLGDLFDDAIYPVSEEIFELTKDGIRAVGAFRSS